MKTSERDMARKLRQDGLSVREIEERVGVARSSVSLWVRDIKLTEEQRHNLRYRPRGNNGPAFRARRQVFARFLRHYFHIPDAKFRVCCNLFADHLEKQHEIEQHWLDTLELSRESLTKSIVNVYSRYSQKKRQNKLPYGTCRLTVCDVRVVQHLYGAIQEYGGFERPAWLA